jgi:hypothetical protein
MENDPVATARGSVTVTPSGFSADEPFPCIEELQTSCSLGRSARDGLPHSIECHLQFCSRNRDPWFPLLSERGLGTPVAQAPLDKKAEDN